MAKMTYATIEPPRGKDAPFSYTSRAMQLIHNTLETEVETWDDPGDYPSAAGSYPLPSYEFVAAVLGEIVLTLDAEEIAAFNECPADFIDGIDKDLPSPVTSCQFDSKLEGATLTLTPTDTFEADAIEPDSWDDD